MNIQGMLGKVANNADKIGMILGFIADPMANGGFANLVPFVQQRVMNWKVPNINNLIQMYMTIPPYKNTLDTGLMAYIGGTAAEWLGYHGAGSKLAKDFGKGLITGSIIAAVVLLPAINPHGLSGNPTSGNPGNEYW